MPIELYKEKNWKEHNKLVPLYRQLYESHDFGFSPGDIVETYAWSRWEPAKILEHDPVENTFFIRNEKGWECIASGLLMRRLPPEIQQSESVHVTAADVQGLTQLSLF